MRLLNAQRLLAQRRRQGGQVMVLFALALVALVVAVGIAIDGGFGLLQYRQAQNAADFAAEAAAQALYPNCTATGAVFANELIYSINDVVNANSPSTNTTSLPPWGWSGYYLASTSQPLQLDGADIPIYSGTAYPGGYAPVGACGVHINVSPQWPPFIAQILGVVQLRTATGASALNGAAEGSAATSIVALAENGAHTILMAGDGLFEVDGTIFDNSNGCLTHSSPESIADGCGKWGNVQHPDILDGKQSGTMYDWGTLEYSSIVDAPWDSCFGTPSGARAGTLTAPSLPASDPSADLAGMHDASCSANDTNVWYGTLTQGGSPRTSFGELGLPAPPGPTDAGCGGQVNNPATGTVGPTTATADYPAYPAGTTVYYPGVYTSPVVITGNAVFYDCSQTDDITGASPPNPGIYYFAQGLVIRPVAGTSVFGNNVLLVTQNPIPNGTIASSPSGVPGEDNGYQNTGDGEPTIGYGSANCDGTSTGETCSGQGTSSTSCSVNGGAARGATATLNCNSDANAQCGNSICFKMNPTSSQGLNDSLQIGGNGTVNLSGPQDGDWNQFVFWQLDQAGVAAGGYSPGDTEEANIGLDNLIGDSANITLSGVLVDATNFQGQDPTNERYWGGNASLPYVPGGLLVAGYGIATDSSGSDAYGSYGTGLTCGAGQAGAGGSGCQVYIDGLALVGMFQTQGETQLAIAGSGKAIAGVQGSAILTG